MYKTKYIWENLMRCINLISQNGIIYNFIRDLNFCDFYVKQCVYDYDYCNVSFKNIYQKYINFDLHLNEFSIHSNFGDIKKTLCYKKNDDSYFILLNEFNDKNSNNFECEYCFCNNDDLIFIKTNNDYSFLGFNGNVNERVEYYVVFDRVIIVYENSRYIGDNNYYEKKYFMSSVDDFTLNDFDSYLELDQEEYRLKYEDNINIINQKIYNSSFENECINHKNVV